VRRRRVKFQYLLQESALPPSFVLSLKDARMLNENLKKFVEHYFRKCHDYVGVPIRVRYTN